MFDRGSAPFVPQTIDAAQSWERRRDESLRAFGAFKLYLHSETRRLAEVAEKLVPACSVPNVARWSSRYSWPQRAWAFDKEEDRKQQEHQARDRMSASKRHLKIAQELQSVALHGLLEYKAKIAAGTPLNMAPNEIKDMLGEAIKLERLVLGTEKDRKQYTEIRVFLGRHRYENEKDDGEEQQYEEWMPNPSREDTGGDAAEPRRLLPTISRCRRHGYGSFHEKRGWWHWRLTSAAPILMMKKKQNG